MFDRHTLIFCGVLFIIAAAWHFWDRWYSRYRAMRLMGHYPPNTRIWKYHRYEGGGVIAAPHPMTEAEAIDFCRSLGPVMYVDREHGFIFYRPK